jgi:hypothetical protein
VPEFITELVPTVNLCGQLLFGSNSFGYGPNERRQIMAEKEKAAFICVKDTLDGRGFFEICQGLQDLFIYLTNLYWPQKWLIS